MIETETPNGNWTPIVYWDALSILASCARACLIVWIHDSNLLRMSEPVLGIIALLSVGWSEEEGADVPAGSVG